MTSHMNPPKTAKQGSFGDDSPVCEIFFETILSLRSQSLPQTSFPAATLVTGLSECTGFGLEPLLRCFLLSQMQAHPVTASR